MGYYIYGKRPSDTRFAPLDRQGVRCARKMDAIVFNTKSEASNWLAKKKVSPGNIVEVRAG